MCDLAALDEATKKADCRVAYAKSFAGAANANTKLAGEIIGILAAPTPRRRRPVWPPAWI
ncbi:MAG: hypothetical protein ACLTNE_14990 [Intestinimonas butyriciproducens]